MSPKVLLEKDEFSLLPWSGAANLIGAIALFAAITGLRFAVDGPEEGVAFLYVIPISMLALQYGVSGVLAGTTLAFILFSVWAGTHASGVGEGGSFIRLLVFAAPAGLLALVAGARKRARAELADNASILGAIAANLTDALYVKDPEGRYVIVNSAAAAVTGHTPEQVLGRTDEELLPAAVAEQIRAADAALAAAAEPIEDVGSVDLGDGPRVFRALRGPLFARDGSFRGQFGLARDITDEHRHEDYLRVQVRISEKLVEAPSLDELPQIVLSELVEGAEEVEWAAYWTETGEPGIFRCLAVVGDGDTVAVGEERELGGVPKGFHVAWREARGSGGPTALIPVGSIGVAMVGYRRVVPQPETIEAVFKPTLMMVGGYVERTRLAAEAERSKNEFFGLISHELRTPLTSIIGYAELLAEVEAESISPQGRKFIEVIERNARRELRLVQDLLLLVRLEGDNFTLEREATDLRALIEQSCDIVRPQAEAAGVAVNLEAEPIEPVWVDPHRIGQAIDNLLTNAIKFSEAGDRVDVRLRTTGDAVTVEVEDEGPGVPADEVERLFERLYRARGAIVNQVQGTGLGLTIVKSVVEAHGGSVTVESTEGVGTKFTIELPLQAPPEAKRTVGEPTASERAR